MKTNAVRILFTIFCLVFLVHTSNNFATIPETPELVPGSASGKLSINVQTFKMKYAYARKMQEQDAGEGGTVLVLVTNRKFPQDLSKLTRFELGKWMDRYDLQGIDFGFDEQLNLTFIDVLRAPKMIVAAQFQPAPRKQGQVAGRIYTEGEVRYFRNKVKFDIKFNAKL